MGGTGKTVVPSGARSDITGTVFLNRTLENSGTVNYSGNRLLAGYIVAATGTINNLGGATFTVSGGGSFEGFTAWGGSGHAFNNAGTFTKTGIGSAVFHGFD